MPRWGLFCAATGPYIFIEKWIFMPIIFQLSSDLFSEMQDNTTHCTTALHWKIYSLLHLAEMEWWRQ